MRAFLKDESGQGIVEYGIMLMLVSVVGIAALTVMGKKANNSINNAAGYLS
jgi:pilus assembly protein Flp/PilA